MTVHEVFYFVNLMWHLIEENNKDELCGIRFIHILFNKLGERLLRFSTNQSGIVI
jgi:hypothetical protein